MKNNSTLPVIKRTILRAALPAAIALFLMPLPAVFGDSPSSEAEGSLPYADPICNLMVNNLKKEMAAINAFLENCPPEGQAAADKAKCEKYTRRLELTDANLLRVKEQCDNGLTPTSLPKVVDNPDAAVPCAGCKAGKKLPKLPVAGKVMNLKAGNTSSGVKVYDGVAPLGSKDAPAMAAAPAAAQPARAPASAGASRAVADASNTTVTNSQSRSASSPRAPVQPATQPRAATPATPADANLIPRPVVYWAGGTGNLFIFFGNSFGNLLTSGGVTGANAVTAAMSFVPVDPAIWDFVNIPYPAAIFPMAFSIQLGKTMVIRAIKSRPGPFALAGTSQGSIVMNEVYKEIRYGSLQSRRKDLLAGCQFGDPLREQGILFPGCPDPGVWNDPGSRSVGHGIFPAAKRLKGTESFWLEFANVGDPVCTTGDDAVGVYFQLIGNFVFLGQIDGDNFKSALRNITAIPKVIGRLVEAVKQITSTGYVNPHNGYNTIPAWPGAKETSSQIAARYLNNVGQTYYNNARQAALKK